nr:MAG TPA: hypothetical protein [Caudoviricetes sp.]
MSRSRKRRVSSQATQQGAELRPSHLFKIFGVNAHPVL